MENESQSTPMAKVWMVVICTMAATTLCVSVWHFMSMSRAHMDDERESQTVQEDIIKLTAYRDQLKLGAASSSITNKK